MGNVARTATPLLLSGIRNAPRRDGSVLRSRTEAMLQIGPQVPAPNLRRARSNVVFDIDLPPRIEDRAARRVSQAVEKCFDYWRSRQRPYDFA
jgi:hypothetical protein